MSKEEINVARQRVEKGLTREQCYLCIMRKNESPPEQTKSPDQLRLEHHDFLLDLERRGMLFAAGPFRDENGQWSTAHGIGMIIVRAKTRAEAEAIAFSEPFTKAGWHTMEVAPWQRNEGTVHISVHFANGILEIDNRTYELKSKG
jgi:uncharacterized protein YciI